MEIVITVTVDESEARAIDTQLKRAGSGESMDAFVSRMTAKVVRGWAAQQRQEFVAMNRPVIEAIVEELAVDPERAEKLAALGVEFAETGVLRRIADDPPKDEPEPVSEPTADEPVTETR